MADERNNPMSEAAAAGAEVIEQSVERIRALNEQLIEVSKASGLASLDAYEKTLKNLTGLQEQATGGNQLEWVNALAAAHMRYVQEVSQVYTSAARSMLD